ncbi:MAG TPA: HAD family phosphatase [Patescibacteria group bacterium]|nr:HAD family phosphatase [Patescibacteria group bacterium]
MIKAIVFDYAGVLVDGPLIQWLKENIDDVLERKRILSEVAHKGDLWEGTFDAFLTFVGSRIGISKDDVLGTVYREAMVKKDVFDLVKKLKQTYTIVLFSNNQHEAVYEVLHRNDVLYLFDELIISSKYKLLKPQPAFFQKMLSILHMKKEEIIFFDDTKENVETARQLGISAFLFKDAKQLQKDLAGMGITT